MSVRMKPLGQGADMGRADRYGLLAVLFSTQFVALGFFYYALAAVLRSNGVPLAQIGLLQLFAVFQVIRFAWAPLVDRYGSSRFGHYRSWLLAMHLLMVAALVVLGPLDIIADLPLVLTVVGAIALLSATQDIAADATAVRILATSERGIGNGIQLAGSYGGFLIGGSAVVVVYDRIGWGAALTVLAVLTAVPLPFLLRFREPARAPVHRPSIAPAAVGGFFRQPGAARWALVVMPLYYLGVASGYPLITPMLVDAGWELDRIGTVLVIGGGTVVIGGALAAGAVLSAVGRRRALVMFGLVQVAAAIGLLPLTRPQPGAAVVLAEVALLHLAYAVTGTAIFTVSMDWTRQQSAGTDYTVQACFAQLCSHGAGAASLAVAGSFGYPVIAALSAGLGIVGTGAVWLFQRRPVAATA
jgi:predicted MFS family arabinose efflux permease